VRKWLITIVIVGALGALAWTAPRWLPMFLAFLGANSTAIQTLGSFIQLLLWGGAGLTIILRVLRSSRTPMPLPPAQPQPAPLPAAPQPALTQPTDAKPPPPPRPRAAVSALHQLPPPPQDFTGREAELKELLGKLEQGGVTISGLRGLGGVGKTALALKLAEKLAAGYPDAQFYLDLKGHDEQKQQPLSPAEAMAHVVRAYHPTAKLPAEEAALRPLYLSVLRDQRALLLMDNARDAAQVLPLVPPPGCVLLVTSRQHFTLPGLYAKDLDTLPTEDARKLLLAIAPRIGDQADAIAKLCDRLPLALRLAASALAERRDLSPADYARRLADTQQRLQLLGGVEASLSLSYDLFTADLQQRWRTLAVFPDTFDLAAAAAVWALDTDAAHDTLGELVKYSLLDWDDTARRYSLHDLARLFAANRLSADERHTAQARHAAHYLSVLRTADNLYKRGGEALMRGLMLFDMEWTNIQAGQSWAVRHADNDKAATSLCARYPDVGANVLPLRQHPRERINWMDKALTAARQLPDRGIEATHLGNLGSAYTELGEPGPAVELYQQDLAIRREIGDRRGEGIALGGLGNAYYASGEIRRAIDFYEQHLAIARETGDRRGEGAALGNLGGAYYTLGETHRAIEFYEQDIDIAREIGDRHGEGIVLFNMSLALDKLGDRKRAIALAEAALKIREQIKDPEAAKVRAKLAEWRGEPE
jgi:tetratricopeptide (TPR) repeat protein